MQTNDDWKARYEQLVDAKVARLKSLAPEDLKAVRQEWSALIEDVRQALTQDPAGARAQELAGRWLDLLGRLMGGPVDRQMVGARPPTRPRAIGRRATLTSLSGSSCRRC